MGIESDQLVFDYLSRVGDLAQQRGLPSGTRMRLVSGLRAEIDGQRADSVSGVQRILARLGTPEAVVAAAGGDTGRTPDAPRGGFSGTAQGPAAGSVPRSDGPGVPFGPLSGGPSRPEPARPSARERLTGLARRSGLTGRTPIDGKASADGAASGSGTVPGPRGDAAPSVGLPPHLAGADELGDGSAPDWWRVEPGPFGPGETVPGFVGGIEIPEMWDRPERDRPLSLRKDGEPEADEDGTGADGDGADRRGRPLPRLLRRALGRPPAPVAAPAGDGGEEAVVLPARPPLSPVLSLAVLLLVAGAALGSWLALAGGWGLAYASRRLTRPEAKFAALGVPGIVVGGLVVWLWGRFAGRWGAPIAHGRLGPEMLDGLPGMIRVAAVASALFLVWRMRRVPR
ncbi:hypothetical protein [Streptomyces kronopolitis]|uniref:hypothetical protein n=1 Tax=Streptomyces kronopolitis TaxID=1612435 RepID=UPI00369BFB92